VSAAADQLEDELGGTLDLTDDAVLLVVRGPVGAAPEVARWLRSRVPRAHLCRTLSEVFTLPPGATAFVPFESDDASLLNERRPSLARARLRVLLWIDRDDDLDALRTRAQDTWTWRSAFVVLGERSGEPVFMAEALEAAAAGECWAVSGDLEAAHEVDAERPFGEVLAAVHSARPGERVRWIGVIDAAGIWRARWAHLLVPGRLPVLPAEPRMPGVVWIDPRPLRYVAACRALAAASDPGALALGVDLDPQSVQALVASSTGEPVQELAWTGWAARQGRWDLHLPRERPWQRVAAEALQTVALPDRFSLDPAAAAPWQVAEALRQGCFGLAASTAADLGELDAALHLLALDPAPDTVDHHFFAACVFALVDRGTAERHRDALPPDSPEQQFATGLLLGADGDAEGASGVFAALTGVVPIRGRWGEGPAGQVSAADSLTELLAVLEDATETFGANPLRLGAAKAALYALAAGNVELAEALVVRHHLARFPHAAAYDVRAGLAAAQLRHVEVIAIATQGLEAVERAAPGRYHPIRVLAALRLAAARRWTGDLAGVAPALAVARAIPFPTDPAAQRLQWVVDAAEIDHLGRPIDAAVVRRGLELGAGADKPYHLAVAFAEEHPEDCETLAFATRWALADTSATPSIAPWLALEWGHRAPPGELMEAASAARTLADRTGDTRAGGLARMLLAEAEPGAAVDHLRAAVALDDAPDTKLALAGALADTSPGEGLALASGVEQAAVREGRDDLAAVAAFTGARCRADARRVADDLQRALLVQGRSPHPALTAPDVLPVWEAMLRYVARYDRLRAQWLARRLIQVVPATDRATWHAALADLMR
jgi:hypothetical protein